MEKNEGDFFGKLEFERREGEKKNKRQTELQKERRRKVETSWMNKS